MIRFLILFLLFNPITFYEAEGQINFIGAYDVGSSPLFHNGGLELKETSSHEFVCLSYSKDHVASPYMMGLTKIDSIGRIKWKKYINIPCSGTQVYPRGVIELKDNNYLFFGFGQILCQPLYNSVGYFVKTDTSGNILWSKYFGGTYYQIQISDLKATSDSGFIVCGTNVTSVNNFIAKFNVNGDSLWMKTYFSSSAILGSVNLIEENLNQSFSALCVFNNQPLILNLNSSGDSITSFIYPDTVTNATSGIIDFKKTEDGKYISEVASFDTNNHTILYKYYFETDSSGNLIWKRILPTLTYGKFIILNDTSIIFSDGLHCSNNFGTINGGVTRVDYSGNIIWQYCFNYQYTMNLYDFVGYPLVNKSTDGSFLITGAIDSIGQQQSESIFYMKIDSLGQLLMNTNENINEESNFTIFPNPSNDRIYIKSDSKEPIYNIKIIDVLGKEKFRYSSLPVSVDIHNLDSGIYFIILNDKYKQESKKFLKY